MRKDFPNEWTDLLPTLAEMMKASLEGGGATANGSGDVSSPNTCTVSRDAVLVSRRTCLGIHHILKELSSKRLPADRRNFNSIAEMLFPIAWSCFCSDTSRIVMWMTRGGSNGNAGIEPFECIMGSVLERWSYLLKIVSRVLIFGTGTGDARSLEEVPMVVQTAPVLVDALRALLQLSCTITADAMQSGAIDVGGGGAGTAAAVHATIPNLSEWLFQSATKIIKTLTALQELHPWSLLKSNCVLTVAELLDGFLTGSTALAENEAAHKAAIKCMLYFHELVRCGAYKQAIEVAKEKSADGSEKSFRDQERQMRKRQLGAEVERVIELTFNAERMQRLTGVLVSKFIRLSDEDIEEWSASPEAYYHEQEVINWQDCARPCAESLLVLFVQEKPDVVVPMLVTELTDVDAIERSPEYDGPPTADMLRREAAYSAVCAASYELHLKVDFAPWLQGSLLPAMRDLRACMRPMRRRAAAIISKWVPCVPAELRPVVYEALVLLLRDGEDSAVRLAACAAMRALVDDWNFEEDHFIPFVAPCFQCLLALLAVAQEFDTQIQAFGLLSLLIERLGERVSPHIGGLVSVLPTIWQAAEGQSLVRIQVLVALQRLVVTLGEASSSLYPTVLPMLTYSIDVTQPESVTLAEDGMAVWQSLMRQAPSAHAQLTCLVPGFLPLLARGFDQLDEANSILQSYVLLYGRTFMEQYSQVVTGFLDLVIGNVKEKGMLLTLPLIDMVMTLFPAESPMLMRPFLLRLLGAILHESESNLVCGGASSIVGRLLLIDVQAFAEFFVMADAMLMGTSPGAGGITTASATGAVSGEDAARVFESNETFVRFLDSWLDKIDCIAQYSKRKLTALALCKLFHLCAPTLLLPRLSVMIGIITGILCEMYEISVSTPESPGGSSLSLSGPLSDEYFLTVCRSEYGGSCGDDDIGGEGDRRQQWFEHDPVTSANLVTALHDGLYAALHGPAAEQVRAALAQIDETVLRDLGKFVPGIPMSPQCSV